MSKLQIKQISGKPAVKYSDIGLVVAFTFNDGAVYGDSLNLKTTNGFLNLSTGEARNCPADTLCTVYKSTLTMEV